MDRTAKQPNRRQFLRLAGMSAAGLASAWTLRNARLAQAGYWEEQVRKVALYNLWTEEYLDATYWIDGEYQPDVLLDYDYLLRDWRSEEVGNMFYGVLDQLFWLGRALGTEAPFGVVSGFRSESTNHWLSKQSEGVATHSLHTLGMAIDIRMDRIDAERVWRMATDLGMGGTGLYRSTDFVHLDVGPVRTWTS